jgi:hypothetical protein
MFAAIQILGGFLLLFASSRQTQLPTSAEEWTWTCVLFAERRPRLFHSYFEPAAGFKTRLFYSSDSDGTQKYSQSSVPALRLIVPLVPQALVNTLGSMMDMEASRLP